MVHAAELKDGIADTGGYAGTERRHQHLVRALGNLVLAQQDLDGVRAEAGMIVAFATLFLMAESRFHDTA